MKIAITSSGDNLESLLDRRFGRCAFFAIYDSESQNVDFVENTAKDADSGAGPAAVSIIASAGVKKIVSGEFGFKIKSMLDDLAIQMVMLREDKTIAEIVSLLDR